MRLLVAVTVVVASFGFGTATADAVVSDVHPVDGPSTDVVEVADAAMAEDGSGGIVYLRREGGRDHVFAAQYHGGRWRAPQRVDAGQAFDSSWPRIGAGDGGRLVVTWVQESGVDSDRMLSATLDPGARGFQPPVPVDLNVGEATATFPDLAMARGGQAYLAYRVVTDTGPANPPGYVGADVRLARYGGRLWSVLGTPVDRNPAIPVRAATEATSPKVGVDVQGQAIVAWHEPGDDFVDRVWARRVFGAQVGIPLPVSPATFGGAPLRGPVDAFALDVAGFGQGAVAFRQQPGQGGALGAARTFVNEIPDVFAERSGEFAGARIADGAVRGELGAPSVAVDPRSAFVTGFASGTATLLGAGDDATAEPGSAERLDTGGSSVAGDPVVDLAETGAAVAAWRELRGGAGAVAIQERRADGVNEPATLSALHGGAVGRLVLGGSGLGDAIVAWRQGTGAGAQIAAAVVDAPPDPFLVLLPDGWRRGRRIPIAWDRALSAIGGLTYAVSIDDEPVIEGLRRLRARLTRDDVGDGRHRVQVFAIDDAGQETGSRAGRLLVDRTAPRIRLRRRGRTVAVAVSDGRRRVGSGVRPRAIRISFGDGARAARRPRARHTYAGPGTYRLVVSARDRAGNRTVARRKVRVR
jgi:PKD domain